MKWIVETDVFDEGYLEKMETVFMYSGIPYEIIKYIPFADPTYLPVVPDGKAIVYGSINLLKQVQRHTKWTPGAVVTWDNYKCSNYYPIFHTWLLNSDAVFVPLNCVGDYMKKVGAPMFIRPDDGDKIWVGGVYDPYEAERHAEYVMGRHDPTTMMLISEPKNLSYEWRFFVVGNEIITGSQYRYLEKKDIQPLDNSMNQFGAFVLMDEMLREVKYRPDQVFAFDIAKKTLNNKYYLLELSAFNCAGLYGCDIEKLVRAVHQHYTGKRFWS
jgi:hypothetical protein